MVYKAILSDVDGTLVPVGPHTRPTQKVIDAIKKAQEKGVKICLVSGRPMEWLTETISELHITDPCVINGGSQIVDPIKGTVLWEQEMDKDDLEKLLQITKQDNLHFLVNDSGIETKDTYKDFYAHPIAMQIFYLNEDQSAHYLQLLSQFKNLACIKIFSWEKGKFDIYISHKDATKEHAARKLIELLSLTSDEVIGVGDGNNDIPLLSVCGLKVAMGNAFDSVKEYADYTAPTLEEDGVAEMIEKFVLH